MIPEIMKRIQELENITQIQAERIKALSEDVLELRQQLQVDRAPQVFEDNSQHKANEAQSKMKMR